MEDSKKAAVELEKAGVDIIDISGGFTEPEAAEKLLSENKADLIGVGRAILNDSDWAKMEGFEILLNLRDCPVKKYAMSILEG